MSIVKGALCDKMLSDLDTALSLFEMEQNTISKLINSVNKEMSFSIEMPTGGDELNAIQNEVGNLINDNVPKFDQDTIDEVNDLMLQCFHFQGFNPNTLLANLISFITDKINALIDFMTLHIPEFKFGLSLSDIDFKLKGPSLGGLIPEMDGLINCLSNICGQDLDPYIDRMNGAMDSLHMTDEGEFDVDAIFDQTTDQAQNVINNNIKQAKNSYDNVKTQVSDSATNLWNTSKSKIDTVKNLTSNL